MGCSLGRAREIEVWTAVRTAGSESGKGLSRGHRLISGIEDRTPRPSPVPEHFFQEIGGPGPTKLTFDVARQSLRRLDRPLWEQTGMDDQMVFTLGDQGAIQKLVDK